MPHKVKHQEKNAEKRLAESSDGGDRNKDKDKDKDKVKHQEKNAEKRLAESSDGGDRNKDKDKENNRTKNVTWRSTARQERMNKEHKEAKHEEAAPKEDDGTTEQKELSKEEKISEAPTPEKSARPDAKSSNGPLRKRPQEVQPPQPGLKRQRHARVVLEPGEHPMTGSNTSRRSRRRIAAHESDSEVQQLGMMMPDMLQALASVPEPPRTAKKLLRLRRCGHNDLRMTAGAELACIVELVLPQWLDSDALEPFQCVCRGFQKASKPQFAMIAMKRERASMENEEARTKSLLAKVRLEIEDNEDTMRTWRLPTYVFDALRHHTERLRRFL